ncbi:hypothetical protein Riv7116_1456 [Rivularia sp. PCC 7116]|nr:hypothetical protein Riv7116_1456 [Rivularia sp. PCC 7116]
MLEENEALYLYVLALYFKIPTQNLIKPQILIQAEHNI